MRLIGGMEIEVTLFELLYSHIEIRDAANYKIWEILNADDSICIRQLLAYAVKTFKSNIHAYHRLMRMYVADHGPDNNINYSIVAYLIGAVTEVRLKRSWNSLFFTSGRYVRYNISTFNTREFPQQPNIFDVYISKHYK